MRPIDQKKGSGTIGTKTILGEMGSSLTVSPNQRYILKLWFAMLWKQPIYRCMEILRCI